MNNYAVTVTVLVTAKNRDEALHVVHQILVQQEGKPEYLGYRNMTEAKEYSNG